MPVTTRTTDFGEPVASQTEFRLKISSNNHDNKVDIALHWNDKIDPTHVWVLTIEELQAVINFAKRV